MLKKWKCLSRFDLPCNFFNTLYIGPSHAPEVHCRFRFRYISKTEVSAGYMHITISKTSPRNHGNIGVARIRGVSTQRNIVYTLYIFDS